ncbi:MAG: hypothetical protein ACI92G_003681 [Candidatus Pelagisphaera sp.]|jgi:hypothetical protein
MASANHSIGELQYWNQFVRLRFFRLSMREKSLSILFVAALLGVWFSFQIDRHGATLKDIRMANAQAEEQGQWFLEQPNIDARYEAMLQEIDLEELPSVEAVSASIDDLMRNYGFDYRMNQPNTASGVPLTFHVFSATIRKADYNKLIDFTSEIKSSLPYVSLREIKITAEAKTGESLDVNLDLKSIEYTK